MLDQICFLLANIKVGVLDTLQVAQQQSLLYNNNTLFFYVS